MKLRKYKKDKESGKILVKMGMLEEWRYLDDVIKEHEDIIKLLKKEAKEAKTFKEKLKNGLIKKIKEI